jgi:anti-sigma factor RsiW
MAAHAHSLSCRELLDFLADYLEGDLAPGVRGSFERHLAVCVDCRRYLAEYAQTIHIARNAFEPRDAELENVPEELVAAILASRDAP